MVAIHYVALAAAKFLEPGKARDVLAYLKRYISPSHLAHPVGLEPTAAGLTDQFLRPVELRCITFGAATRDRTETSCSSGERADPLHNRGMVTFVLPL